MTSIRNLALAALAGAALTLPLSAMAQSVGTPGSHGKSPVHDSMTSVTTLSNGQGKGSTTGRAFVETQATPCTPGSGACGLGPKAK